MDNNVDLQSHLPTSTTGERKSLVGLDGENSAKNKTNPIPTSSGWNSDQFHASLNTNLLTFSVAPLTHVIQTIGTTIHQHDVSLQDIIKQLQKVEKDQQELSKRKPTPAVSDDLSSKFEELEKRVNDVESNVEQTNSREELLTNKLGAMKDLEDRTGEQEISISNVQRDIDHLNTRLGDFVTILTLEMFKNKILDEVQSMLKQATERQTIETDTRIVQLQQDIFSNSNQLAEESDDDTGDILKPAHIPPAETTMETSSRKKSKRTENSMRVLMDPALKFQVEQLEQQLKLLSGKMTELEEHKKQAEDEVQTIQGQIVQCNLDASQFRQDMISAFDELAAKTNTQVTTSVLSASPLPAAPTKKYDEDIQKHSDRIERITKQLGELNICHGADHEQVELSQQAIKALQDEIRKVKSQVDEFQENQSLMQGFTALSSTGDGGEGPDLSLVFAKLAEMRQVQNTTSDDLRRQLDELAEWARNHKTQWQTVRLAEEAKTQTDLRYLDERVGFQKDGVQQQLHLQEHIMGQVSDWVHAIPAIRKEFEKQDSHDTQKIVELQTMIRQYYRAMPSVASLQACSQGLHANMQPLHHALGTVADSSPTLDMTDREESIRSLTSLLSTFDKHNDSLLKQYDHVRVQMDDLWNLWQKRLTMEADNKYSLLSKEITEVALHKPKVVMAPQQSEPSHPVEKRISLAAQAISLTEGNDAVKRLEQLLLTCCRRLDGFEDDLRVLTRNVHAYRGDMADRVTEGHLSKLKFQIFAELAKIHAVIGSSKFQNPTNAKVYDDSEIKSTLDMQAELIASLCTELKKEKVDAIEQKPNAPHENDNDKLFNAKLESITERVAEMFVSLEVQRSTTQPRNIIPAYNPTLLLEAFAQNIEAKLAQTQDLTKKDIERIKAELGDNVRVRVRRAMEALKDKIPTTEATTAVGTVPAMVCCIACSRPIQFDTSTGDVVREVPRMNLGLPDPEADDDNWEREGESEFVYRAGFRMPVNEKRSVLPLLVSPRAPKAKGGDKSKSRRFMKNSKKVDTLMREVEDLDHDTMNLEKQIDYKKSSEGRKPVAPTR